MSRPPLRPVRDADSEDLIELIGGVFAEYPGVVLDVEREEPELLAPAARFERMWVFEEDGRVRGCVAARTVRDAEPPFVELKKMYVARELRGRGLGRLCVERVEDYAAERGVRRVELWSDTRFETAHAVYARLGYERSGRTRELRDLSATREFHFAKTLAPPSAPVGIPPASTRPSRGPG